ncbi:hypothetical protein ACTHQ1_03620 [Janibacter anophelis]|uniref:hypothetical protein n=1 Tax=Janibacter anophelis TaxID=319054 RepID=UPI003F7EA000
MTSLYPRLPFGAAAERLEELRLAREDGVPLQDFVAFRHPKAVWAATGGSTCSESELERLRAALLETLEPNDLADRIPRNRQVKVDLAMGRALSSKMEVNPADAGHDEVWSFLTLVVLPDVAAARFPDLHHERMFGTHRNTFRRLWVRDRAIGDLMEGSANPLGEDEMVGIFERSELSRNPNLVKAMAKTVLDSKEGNRTEFARNFYKRVRFHTGAYALDLHSEDELLKMCARFAAEN